MSNNSSNKKKNNVIVEVTVVPMGTATPSLSAYVAEVERVLLKYSHIKRLLTPMSTILEGDLDDILTAMKEMHEAPFLQGAQRVSTCISIDDRRDKVITMAGKIKAIEEKL